MVSDTPFFSVVIPTCNRPGLLSRAVDSVLRSSERSVEIVVVNDGSTDSYESILENFSGKIHYYENRFSLGAAASRNTGVSLAKGRWIAFLDDDDELTPGYLSRVKEAVGKNGNVPAFWTGARVVKSIDDRIEVQEREFPDAYDSAKYLIKDLLSIGLGYGFVINKKVFELIGMFDETYSVGEDTELFFRMVSNDYIPMPISGVGVIKHEEHKKRLSSDYRVYSRENIYNRIFEKHRNGFCEKWRYNYIHMLMWSYRLHREYGNKAFEVNDFGMLVQLGIPKEHIDECYLTGSDLSVDYVK